VTGVDTVLADDCALTVRAGELGPGAAELAAGRQPLRVVLDTHLRTPAGAQVLDGSAPTLLCHAEGAPTERYSESGVDLVALPGADGGLDLHSLMRELARRQCNEILLESGPRLAGALLRAGLVDELIVYMAPALLGDSARPLLALPLDRMADKITLHWVDVRRVGPDWRFTAIPG